VDLCKSGFPPGTTAAPSLLEPWGRPPRPGSGTTSQPWRLRFLATGGECVIGIARPAGRRVAVWKVARSSEMEAPGRRLPVKANQPNRIDHADAGLQCQQSQVPA
jgi:hypothetical protein